MMSKMLEVLGMLAERHEQRTTGEDCEMTASPIPGGVLAEFTDETSIELTTAEATRIGECARMKP